jgi:carbamoyl-phosphate synthase small subunit
MTRGVLVLQDGTVIEGEGFGAEGESQGEVVFATAMAGYQESLTDPSYKYQILMPTYPLIGNYGVTPERFESEHIHVEGFVVRELCEKPNHGRITKTLDKWLKEEGIPGLQGVDTRFLTRKIRNFGVMNGVISSDYDPGELEALKEKAAKMKSISELDLIDLVTVKKPVIHKADKGVGKIVLLDCGAKMSIVKSLVERGIEVIQVPATASAKEILDFEPDGMMVSNGPGDPERAGKIIRNIKEVIDSQLPTFGICFGNQLVGRALGGDTYKLKFGHRGGNQPVKELKTKRVHVTSQNHGFALDADSLPSDVEVTHINLNDKSVEGISHKSLPVYTVQYHPEAHPGPWDSEYLFDEFIKMMSCETKQCQRELM